MIEKGTFIGVKLHSQYINGYQIRKFDSFSGDKILCWNTKETKLLEYDMYREIENDSFKENTYWKNSNNIDISYDMIKELNTYNQITTL